MINTSNESSDVSLRVTSIQCNKNGFSIFTGVPIFSRANTVKSAKYIITIHAKLNTLPVEPSIGQHWNVGGNCIISTYNANGFKLKQHSYKHPTHTVCTLPDNGEQFIRFIADEKDFKGIGDASARALWKEFGSDIHNVLKDDYNGKTFKRLQSILSNQSIAALYSGYRKYANLSHTTWMSNKKIPGYIQQALLKHHHLNSIDVIKSNPYTLLAFGMRFSKLDQLAKAQFEVANNDPRRLTAAVEEALRAETAKGHTYTNQSEIRPKVVELLGSDALATVAFITAYQTEQFIVNPVTASYHPTAILLMEHVVAKRLKSLAKANNKLNDEMNVAFVNAKNELDFALTDKQTEAVITALDNSVSCITGGAGTGKTTVLRTALLAFKAVGYTLHPVALSGRAAMRLNESIKFDTRTIASFLYDDALEVSLFEPKNILVIDEASMIDLPTMFRLVTHIHPSTKILFTGDPNQLPPIGCGKILSDIVESKAIPNITLDIVKRQDGATGIPEYSEYIKNGIVPPDLSSGTITFHEAAKTEINEICASLYLKSPSTSRIIGAVYKPKNGGLNAINKLCQDRCNPHGQRFEFELSGEQKYLNMRENDPVLLTKNIGDLNIQNGTLGTLISVKRANETFGKIELDTGNTIEITQEVLDAMTLGYAISLHKAQGSQFPRIIISLSKGLVVDRSWLYTAITRAEAEVHIVGSRTDFVNITKEMSNANKRCSFLKMLLQNDSEE